MSRYVDIDQIIADIFDKWGCDPAYIANDTPTGIEARRDAKFIEQLRSKPYIEIVRCAECEHYYKDNFFNCAMYSSCVEPDDYCRSGERRKPNE